jgi:hypothetical protein
MLSYRLAGGLGLEPRLAESESFGKILKNPQNVRLQPVSGKELKETEAVESGFIRHNIVTLNILCVGGMVG